MVKKRVSVLYEIWWPEAPPKPPASPMGVRPDDGPSVPESDVHQEIYDALGRIGYSPQYAVLDGSRKSLAKLAEARTSLIFNLTESYAGDDTKDLHVAAFLELLDKPFTGCDARSLHLGQDKALAKKVLRFHRVPTPDFFTVPTDVKRFDNPLGFPVIVKPSREDGSIGIDAGSVVHDEKSLRDRVRYIHESFSGPALVERYVDGREVYVSVIGNEPPEPLPLVELDLSGVPEGIPRIAGTEVKWWKGSEIYRRTPTVYPKKISWQLTKRIQKIAIAAYHALGLRDYGRVDLRISEDGDVYVIEVNPNPWLSSDCEFFLAWKKTGRNYDALVARLVELALARSSNGW